MNQKALKTLEYNKILELLEGFATSSLGKQLCRDLKPLYNIAEIESMQQETADALSRVYQKGALSFSGVKDIRGSLKRLEIGSTLASGNRQHPGHRGTSGSMYPVRKYQPCQSLFQKRKPGGHSRFP